MVVLRGYKPPWCLLLPSSYILTEAPVRFSITLVRFLLDPPFNSKDFSSRSANGTGAIKDMLLALEVSRQQVATEQPLELKLLYPPSGTSTPNYLRYHPTIVSHITIGNSEMEHYSEYVCKNRWSTVSPKSYSSAYQGPYGEQSEQACLLRCQHGNQLVGTKRFILCLLMAAN